MKATSTAVLDGIEIKTIHGHLDYASSKGILHPRLVLGGYKFTLAPATGKNFGCVYVKRAQGGEYLGKIGSDNRFYPALGVPEATCLEVAAIRDNPGQAATVHGQATGTCCCCGRELTAESSINAMIGPICAEKYGF